MKRLFNPVTASFRTLFGSHNVYTFRTWDWVLPGLFRPLHGRQWARHIPDIFTYTRLILGVPAVLFLLLAQFAIQDVYAVCAAFGMVLFLRLTDVLDGRAARDLELTSMQGGKLDPLADGLLGFAMALAATVGLYLVGQAFIAGLFLLVMAFRLALDGWVMALRYQEAKLGVETLANKWGKLKYNLDFLILFAVLVGISLHSSSPGYLTAILIGGAAVLPLTTYFAVKNLKAHYRQLKSVTA